MKIPAGSCEYAEIRAGCDGVEGLRCSIRDLWINPTGYTCELCQSAEGENLWRGLLEPMFFDAVEQRDWPAAKHCLQRLLTRKHAGSSATAISAQREKQLRAHAIANGLPKRKG